MAYRVATAVKFDPSFDRGESAFKGFWQSFMGDRLEMNKALWKARLSAASPETRRKLEKGYEDRIQKLIKMKADIEKAVLDGDQEALKQYHETVRTMYRSDTTLAVAKTNVAGGIHEGRTRVFNDYNAVKLSGNGLFEGPVKELLGSLSEKDMNSEQVRTQITTWWGNLERNAQGEIERDRYAYGMWQAIYGSKNINPDVKTMALQTLGTKVTGVADKNTAFQSIPNKIRQNYGVDALTGINPKEQQSIFRYGARLKGGLPGYGTPGEQPKRVETAVQTIDTQIGKLREQLDATRAEGLLAAGEYKELLRGPRTNLALAPFARKPSRLSEPMRRFMQLYEEDQPYAERILDEDLLGERELPAKYGELDAPELGYRKFEATGETGSLDELLQNKIDEYSLAEGADKASVARRMIGEIHQVVGSRETGGRDLFSGRESVLADVYGSIRDANFPEDSHGTLKEWAEGVVELIGMEEVSESNKDAGAIAAMDSLKQSREDAVPKTIYVGHIEEGVAYPQLTDFGNQRQWKTRLGQALFPKLQSTSESYNPDDPTEFYKSVSELYADLAAAPEELRGAAGTAVLDEIELFQTKHNNPSHLASQLGMIGGQVAGHFAQDPSIPPEPTGVKKLYYSGGE